MSGWGQHSFVTKAEESLCSNSPPKIINFLFVKKKVTYLHLKNEHIILCKKD